ncbi:hypothetical protein [Paractinoplanes deccanensis]|nr:hypothetical protein [Actinoplanes deccanensis]
MLMLVECGIGRTAGRRAVGQWVARRGVVGRLRHDEEGFLDLRALVWSRCRSYLPDVRDWRSMGDEERERLLDGFAPADDTVARSLADVFLDYGDGYMTSGTLCWSPAQVGLFLADWLPRKAALNEQQRAALPEVLRRLGGCRGSNAGTERLGRRLID